MKNYLKGGVGLGVVAGIVALVLNFASAPPANSQVGPPDEGQKVVTPDVENEVVTLLNASIEIVNEATLTYATLLNFVSEVQFNHGKTKATRKILANLALSINDAIAIIGNANNNNVLVITAQLKSVLAPANGYTKVLLDAGRYVDVLVQPKADLVNDGFVDLIDLAQLADRWLSDCMGHVEADCTDTRDNDCDGLIDCADSDCDGDDACAQEPLCGNGVLDGPEECDPGVPGVDCAIAGELCLTCKCVTVQD